MWKNKREIGRGSSRNGDGEIFLHEIKRLSCYDFDPAKTFQFNFFNFRARLGMAWRPATKTKTTTTTTLLWSFIKIFVCRTYLSSKVLCRVIRYGEMLWLWQNSNSILQLCEVIICIWHNKILLGQNELLFGKFHCCEWPNIRQYIWPSGHPVSELSRMKNVHGKALSISICALFVCKSILRGRVFESHFYHHIW